MIISNNNVANKNLQQIVKMQLLSTQQGLTVKDLVLVKTEKVLLQKAADTCLLRLFSLLRACVTPEERLSLLDTLGLNEELITALILQ